MGGCHSLYILDFSPSVCRDSGPFQQTERVLKSPSVSPSLSGPSPYLRSPRMTEHRTRGDRSHHRSHVSARAIFCANNSGLQSILLVSHASPHPLYAASWPVSQILTVATELTPALSLVLNSQGEPQGHRQLPHECGTQSHAFYYLGTNNMGDCGHLA